MDDNNFIEIIYKKDPKQEKNYIGEYYNFYNYFEGIHDHLIVDNKNSNIKTLYFYSAGKCFYETLFYIYLIKYKKFTIDNIILCDKIYEDDNIVDTIKNEINDWFLSFDIKNNENNIYFKNINTVPENKHDYVMSFHPENPDHFPSDLNIIYPKKGLVCMGTTFLLKAELFQKYSNKKTILWMDEYIGKTNNTSDDLINKKYNFHEYIDILDKYNLLTIESEQNYGIKLIKNNYIEYMTYDNLQLVENLHIINNGKLNKHIILIIFLFKYILKCNINKFYIYSDNKKEDLINILSELASDYDYKLENITLDLHRYNLEIMPKNLYNNKTMNMQMIKNISIEIEETTDKKKIFMYFLLW